ncbi:MAG: hypothetical protein QOD74_2477 [Variibacter sp.]|jgi:3-hydroxyisobutyrate dehydrogenase-like beta-hydroxyacid dehydrogenase|nr:hypothetical protein [Variibacter sp.]
MSSKGTVGVIGLGIMGGAIARNLVEAGWDVVGFDTDPTRCDAIGKNNVRIAGDAAAVAREAAVILTSLPKPESLAEVAQAIADAALLRRIVAELSTFAIKDKDSARATLAAAGHTLLDCPLSGTGAQAQVRDLVVYASGDKQAIAALEPVFADFARAAHDLGDFGNGMRMKFVANLLVAIHNVASAEAMVLGMKAGLDPAQVLQLATAGAGNSRVLELRGPMMVENRYGGDNLTMRVATWQKDMQVIADFAREIGAPTPLFAATEAIYNAALATGRGDEDTASVCAVLEAMAGVRR